ncbi:MAG: type VI secretion system tube protein Hcp [Steroidobacteraceae bacterium]|jgi:type VI secretion system Hcp family effector
MAWISYVCFEGRKQGILNTATKSIAAGASRRSSQWIELESFELNSQEPEEAPPGRLKGDKQRFPLLVTLEFGSTSAWLRQAARDQEILTAVIIETVSIDRHGFEHIEERITLTDALIADLRAHTGQAAATGRVLDDLGFTFQTITIITGVT